MLKCVENERAARPVGVDLRKMERTYLKRNVNINELSTDGSRSKEKKVGLLLIFPSNKLVSSIQIIFLRILKKQSTLTLYLQLLELEDVL